ncbi:MAG: alpha/beta hydrolase fold domain-containing protein [Acidobacteria bacterium]|nr:alpha/beta hydrolase fold domain-containing protein [Acidobacteriota bacterium]MBI3486779.1 alpha/beta hydrolase fold domain-containing protein [Acidobacteriota bacterium]
MAMVLVALGGWMAAAEPVSEPRRMPYKSVAGAPLWAHVFLPPSDTPQPRPAVVLFHGGGWNSGDATWVYPAAQRFARLGLVAVAIDYRLADEKAVTPLEAMEDARDAIRWTRSQAKSFHLDPARVVAYGVSAGGQLAAAAALQGRKPGVAPAAQDRPDALVLYSPAVAIAQSGWVRRLLLGRAMPESISPDAFVAPGAPPTYISQGVDDTVTPFLPALLFSRRMKAAGNVCELKPYSSLGHLLTRKLDEQEWGFDPDPVARLDAWGSEEAFLARLGYVPPQPPVVATPEGVVRSLAEALNAQKRGDAERWLAREVVWQEVDGPAAGASVTGTEAVLARLRGGAKEAGAQRELHALVTNGSLVSVRERIVWPGAEPARRTTALVVYRVEGGQVRHIWRYPTQD